MVRRAIALSAIKQRAEVAFERARPHRVPSQRYALRPITARTTLPAPFALIA
jgi:hypothetical protein